MPLAFPCEKQVRAVIAAIRRSRQLRACEFVLSDRCTNQLRPGTVVDTWDRTPFPVNREARHRVVRLPDAGTTRQ
jgi:hypothetical protein